MDSQSAMDAATAGAKAATKFGEILEKIMGPRWAKKQADADAYADERKLQIIRDNPDMEIVYVDGKMHAHERTPEALAYRAAQRQLTESIRQERNIENVLGFVANEVRCFDNNIVSDAPVDDDWITRFFQIVKDINSEEMQFVWGKILAGEIKQPGSFSFRTLEAIKNLSRSDAEVFQKIVPLIITDGDAYCVLSDTSILEKYGVGLSDILILDECGLVNLEELNLQLYVTNTSGASVHTNDRVLVINGSSEEEKMITLRVYTFTKVGIELYHTLSHSLNEEYVFDVAEQFIKQNQTSISKVSVHEINSISSGAIDYKDDPVKQFTV